MHGRGSSCFVPCTAAGRSRSLLAPNSQVSWKRSPLSLQTSSLSNPLPFPASRLQPEDISSFPNREITGLHSPHQNHTKLDWFSNGMLPICISWQASSHSAKPPEVLQLLTTRHLQILQASTCDNCISYSCLIWKTCISPEPSSFGEHLWP